MNYDVAYYTDNIADSVFGMRKRLDSCSISLAAMSPCEDKIWNKKTIYNILSALQEDGLLCIVADIDNVGQITSIMKECKFSYTTICFCPDKTRITSSVPLHFLFCISKKPKIWISPTLIMDNISLSELLVNGSTKPQDTVLVIGYKLYKVALFSKQSCRYVICFLDNMSELLNKEGIKMEKINHAS